MHLLQLLGDFVLASVHLLGASFSRLTISSSRVLHSLGHLGALGTLGWRPPHARVWVLCVVRFQLAFQVLQGRRSACCLPASNLSNAADLATADEIRLPPTNVAKLHQHLMLLANQLGEFVSCLHCLLIRCQVSAVRFEILYIFDCLDTFFLYHLLIFVSSIRHSSRLSTVVLAKSEIGGNRSNTIWA